MEANTTAITLTAPSGTKRYDGTPFTAAGGYKVSGLPKGFSVKAEVAGSQTDVGSSESTIASYAIYDAAGNDVTSYFPNVTKVAGVLKVTKSEDTAADQPATDTAANQTASGATGDSTSGAASTSGKATTVSTTSTAGKASATQASSLPQTGDPTATGAAMALVAAGAGVLAVAHLLRRRRS